MEESQHPTTVAERVKRYRDKRKQEEESKKMTKISDKQISPFKAAARERKRISRELKKRAALEGTDASLKKSYRTHYVKKTVKNTYKSLPRSPAERAEVLSKLAEEALRKLEAEAATRAQNEESNEIEYNEKI